MINSTNEQLSIFSLFKELKIDQIDKIIPYLKDRKIEKNKHIYMQGESMHSIYFLCEGKVKKYKIDAKGKELIVSIYSAGAMFPQSNFFVEKIHYQTSTLVLEDATLISIPLIAFEQLLLNDPELSVILLKLMGKKLSDLQLRLEDKLLNTTDEQVLNLLLRLSKNHAVILSNQKILFLTPFQVKDLANMIGLSRETVSRILAKFLSTKLLEKDNKGRLLLNPLLMKGFQQ